MDTRHEQFQKQVQKKLEAELWFPQRMLPILWNAKKSNKTVLGEADITRSLKNRIKRETGTFCDNWNYQGKMQQGKTARKKVAWTNKVAKCRTSHIYTIKQ